MTQDSFYDFKVIKNDGTETTMADYKGKTLLIVNTASQCGYTVQYDDLEKLYKKYQDKGFVVLGFPCNQFMNQEKGNDLEIASFCKKNFGVTFPLFQKIDVNGENAHPLFEYLKKEKRGILGTTGIKWNFTKFLCHNGKVLKRYSPNTAPLSFEKDIVKVLE